MLLLKGCNCVFEVGALDFFQYGMKVLQGSHIMWQAYGVSSFEFVHYLKKNFDAKNSNLF